jgi:pyrroline-5-carboxylate reductase
MKKIGILGYGNMGGALADGLAKTGAYQIHVVEPDQDRSRKASQRGYKVVKDATALFGGADIGVIAVKPQIWSRLGSVLSGAAKGKPVITMMAGISMASVSSVLQTPRVARYMPNLAATVGQAFIGVSFAEETDDAFRSDVLEIAEALGQPLEIHESLMAAVTGISGSGIAFVFAFLHAMALGGVAAGLPYPSALEAALSTTQGAVTLLKDSGEQPIQWLSRVISPAGTTIRGVEALEAGGLTAAVMKAVQAAASRAEELEG